MKPALPGRFYPVVDSLVRVQLMLEAGARLIQLRVKQPDTPTLRATVRASLAACNAAGAILVLNDHWQAAIGEGVRFLHLGQEDLDQADLPAIRRAGLRLGISTHSDEELDRALTVDPDYVALGPIWPTTLKIMPWAPQGTARLGSWHARLHGIPLVAIGGITLDRAPGCIAAGADAVAVVSDVLSHPDPAQRARHWIRQLDRPAPASSAGTIGREPRPAT